MLRVLTAIAVIVARPAIAFPCGNAMPKEDAANLIIEVELQLDRGDVKRAMQAMAPRRQYRPGEVGVEDELLAARIEDAIAVIEMRAGSVALAVEHFAKRVAKASPDVRHLAWLAEAHARSGNARRAREILHHLHEWDLMPDAFAYLTMAQLTTGSVRTAALRACRTRARVKTICTLTELPRHKE